MAQLTGLRQLKVMVPREVSAVGLRQLAGLQQLTSLGFMPMVRLGNSNHSHLDTVAKHFMRDDLPGCLYAIVNQVGVSALSRSLMLHQHQVACHQANMASPCGVRCVTCTRCGHHMLYHAHSSVYNVIICTAIA